jgi:phenylalanyl-tRNA synthetase beta chain
LHLYDADKIQGVVRLYQTQGGETLDALDGKTYPLPQGAWVVADDGGIIALGGIIGGARTACTAATQRVLVESAFFPSQDIARVGQALGIHTEARARFERGVDPTSVLSGLAQALSLLSLTEQEQYQALQPDNLVVLRETAITERHLTLRSDGIQKLSGLHVPLSEVTPLLQGLGCQVTQEENVLGITPPLGVQTWKARRMWWRRFFGSKDTIPSPLSPFPWRPSPLPSTRQRNEPSRRGFF